MQITTQDNKTFAPGGMADRICPVALATATRLHDTWPSGVFDQTVMQTLAKYDDLNVPTWALGYLVNGNKEGLNAQEIAQCDSWVLSFKNNAPVEDASFLLSTEQEEFFTKWPEFGQACTCVEGTVVLAH